MFVVPLLAGVWILLIAVGVIVDAVYSSVFTVVLSFVGIALIVAGVRMAAGKASAVRLARRSAVLGLAVVAFPAVLVLLGFAFTRDVQRLLLASDVLWWSAAGTVPALVVLLMCRERRASD
ncbi:hypothetical protein V1460_35720 [Streptomyces sp. SCSIO 30461]|uniref:hypothetical protein n=1 Tax=Streptomyces sp. SCSIO 30461 TaxID=3118085 RepID=UPI0030CBC0FC